MSNNTHEVDNTVYAFNNETNNLEELPDTYSGMKIDRARRIAADDRPDPLTAVVGRSTDVVYHVVPKDGDGAGTLVTFTQFRQASSWEQTDVTGSARAKNTPADVEATVVISPLSERTTLPSADSYDPQNDPYSEVCRGQVTSFLSNGILHNRNLIPTNYDRHKDIPEKANWFQLST